MVFRAIMDGGQPKSHVENERGLIAIGELVAADALRPDFPRQFVFRAPTEAVLLKEEGDIRQRENPGDAKFFRLSNASPQESRPDSSSLLVFNDRERPNLRQVLPVHVESDAPGDFPVLLADPVVSQGFIDLAERPVEHHAPAGVKRDQLLDPCHVVDFRLSDAALRRFASFR